MLRLIIPRLPYLFLAFVCLIFGLIFLQLLLPMHLRPAILDNFGSIDDFSFYRDKITVQGKITSLEPEKQSNLINAPLIYCPKVLYSYEGQIFEKQGSKCSDEFNFTVNEEVIVYLYTDTKQFAGISQTSINLTISSIQGKGQGGPIPFYLGSVFALTGILILYGILKVLWIYTLMRSNRKEITAIITKVEPAKYSFHLNHRSPYILYASGINPTSNKKLEFKSTRFWIRKLVESPDDLPYRKGKEIKVFIDTLNQDRYIVILPKIFF